MSPRSSVQPVAASDGALEAALVAALDGEESGFRELYRHVQPGLLRYLRVLVGADAEDVASETWVQVCRDLHRFSGDLDGFRGWVTTIGRHRALDHHRAARRRPADAWTDEELHQLPGAADVEAQALETLSTSAAIELIATLPREQAEAVLLRAVVGLSAAAAANVLGKRAGAVRTSAYRGLKTLAARVGDER